MLEVLAKLVEIIKVEWPSAEEVTSVSTAGIGALHIVGKARDGATVDVSIVVSRRPL